MVLFSLTDALRGHLESAVASAPPERADMYRQCLANNEMSLDVALALKRDLAQPSSVMDLLRGADIVAKPAAARRFRQSPESKAKFDQFRRELEDKKYRRMVESVAGPMEKDRQRDARELKSFKDQMGIAMNVVVTRIALLVAGWWLGHRALGAVWGPVVGITFMVVGLLAEMGIFMIRTNRMDDEIAKNEKETAAMFPQSIKGPKNRELPQLIQDEK